MNRILYPIFGAVAFLTAIGLLIDLIFLKSDTLLAALVIAMAPGFIAAKQSNYNSHWRWNGLIKASRTVLFVWRWSLRIVLMSLVAISFFAAVKPDLLREMIPNDINFVHVFGELFLIFVNVWYCGFVLFGDQTISSERTRAGIDRVTDRIFRRKR